MSQVQHRPKIVSFLGYTLFVREGDSLADKMQKYQRKYGVTLKQIAQKAGMNASYLGRVLKSRYQLGKIEIKLLTNSILINKISDETF